MNGSSAVTVIVPTHDHATTIEYSIRSVLEQTVPDLAVVVIGDGVGDDTRDVVHSIQGEDSRVSFLDRPKAPRHGEILRHEVLQSVTSPFIAYHGDDDLLLPNHLETMIALLADADFAHPLPILVEASGDLVHLPTDLSMEECRAWHVASPPRNAVSLTGVAHTLESYRRLPHGWRTTPPGQWTDHYMWQQFLGIPDLTAVTSRKATAVKLAAVDCRYSGAVVAAILQPFQRLDQDGGRFMVSKYPYNTAHFYCPFAFAALMDFNFSNIRVARPGFVT